MKSKVNYLDPGDFEEILGAIPELGIRKWKNEDVEMLFKILKELSLRPSEGIKLEKKDFDFEDREVYLHGTKTAKRAVVVIPKLFVRELEGYVNSKNEGRLFPGLKYITFYFWLKRLGKLLDVEAWTTLEGETGEKTVGHVFRKTGLKDMYLGTKTKKIDPMIIAAQSRHSNPVTLFKHYLKMSTEAVKEEF